MGTILTTPDATLTAAQAMSLSRAALDAAFPCDARLTVAALTTKAVVLGDFQRLDQVVQDHDVPIVRRISGGPEARVGPGTLHVLLALAHPGALVACDPPRLTNRYVRPLLRALTRGGALAHYFGRDWVSVRHRPIALVGFAHDSLHGRCVFEALVAVDHPLGAEKRGSFRGKEPGTLAQVVGRDFDLLALRERVLEAYTHDHRVERDPAPLLPLSVPEDGNEPPWEATTEDMVGIVGAGRDARGILRLGGDFFASRDAISRVTARVGALPKPGSATAISQILHEELASPGVVLEGARLSTIQALLERVTAA